MDSAEADGNSGRGAQSLAGSVVVVTGASRGIGRAVAALFAAEGAAVVLAARDVEALVANVQEIEASGGVAQAIPTDVSDEASVAAL
ncbi:MAG TPA: SDR family NAD(P)-dependent oxidoreductase, partial [Solirubrobacteraceae bacterium]